MTVNIKLAKVNGALVPYPTSTPTIVSTAIGTLDQYSNTTAVLEFDAVTYANAVSYVNNKAFVNTAQLSSNLANYQTIAGLSANVATLSANNATFAFGKSENNLNVNSALSSNSSAFLGTANLQNIQSNITSNAAAAYTNSVAYVDGKSYVNSSANVTFTGIHTYSSNVIFNAGIIANGGIGTIGQILKSNGTNIYWAEGGAGSVTQINTANGLSGGPITNFGTIGIISNSGIYVNASGVFVNSDYIATLASNSAGFLGNSSGTLVNLTSWISSNAATAYTNSVAYVDGKAYVNTSQLSSNLANYQTTAGLAANVATLTANNATYAYGKTEANLNVNNALTANSSTYLGSANLSNIQTYITSNASAAYTNAVSYVDGKAYVNTSQLSSNLANYALLTGATFSGNVRTQQSAQVDGNLVVSGNLTVSGNVVIIGANNLSVVDNMIYLNSNSTVSNPDLGFAGNYNDGVYRHTGFFRDASDGVWKVFDSYLPEPDASPYIDTANASFKIANFQANVVYVGNTTVYSTVNTTSFSGTANNATYAYGKTEINLNVNNALTANSSTFVGTANLSNIQTFITSNASAAYTNAVAYVDGKAYVNTSQLSSNLANYQTTAGLSGNVATLTANNATYAYGKTENNLNVNNALTANSSVYLGSANLNNIQTFITTNASAAYTNAVAYVDGKSFVNTSQLSSNLANYQTTAGLASNVATLAANSAGFLGNSTGTISNISTWITSNSAAAYTNATAYVDGKAYVNTAQLSSNLANYQTTAGLASNVAILAANSSTYANASISNVFTIGTSTYYVSNGNVGIGTTTPDARLAVSGTANVSGNMTIGGSLTTSNIITVGTSTYFVSNGNVGVGTNSPSYKVAINGGALSSTLGSTANAFQIYSTTTNADYINFSKVREAVGSDWTTAAWRIQQVVDVTPHGYIQFNGNGNAQGLTFGTSNIERIRIDPSGNVGIGNTAPNAKLAITGTANISGNVIIGGALTSANLTLTTNVATIGTAAYFVSNGNIGIGTATPSTLLQIAGSLTPSVDNSFNLGSAALRWANIFTGDLQLSNEGSQGNDIDQTTGSWTIQEGHENLYLINRKTGKKYMFVLKEV